jgi:hypothetical protein
MLFVEEKMTHTEPGSEKPASELLRQVARVPNSVLSLSLLVRATGNEFVVVDPGQLASLGAGVTQALYY